MRDCVFVNSVGVCLSLFVDVCVCVFGLCVSGLIACVFA